MRYAASPRRPTRNEERVPALAGIAALAALSLVLAAGPAAAEAPRIRGLAVEVEEHRTLVDFQLLDGFDAEVAERVSSGLATTFTYELELLRDRKRWFDRPIQRTQLQVIALFDAVAREYLVNYKLDGKLIESRMVHSLDELAAAMSRFEGVPAFTLQPLPRRWRLLIKVRAVLGSQTLFRIIPMQVETKWRESKKFMAPEDLMPPR